MASRPLLKGTLILTLASVFCRFLGLGNRMLLSRLIGAEGLGLFQMILPFYTLAAVLVTLGLPGAVVKSVSDRFAREDLYGMEQVRSQALRCIRPAALLGGLLLFLLTFSPLAALAPDERIILPLRWLSPALLCVAAASIYKGFFQGQQNMAPTALSQALEQVFRVFFSLLGVLLLLPYGLEYAVLGIVFGVTLGEAAGLALLLFVYRRHRGGQGRLRPRQRPRFAWQVQRELAALALPLLVIRLSASLTFTVESFLIPARLQIAGYSPVEATALLGELAGMALPLLFLPTVFIIPLSTAMVPSIAAAAALGQKKRLRRLLLFALGSTALLGLSGSGLIHLFAGPLTSLLYGTAGAAPLLQQMAPAAPFAYLQFVTAAILHGLGRPGVALMNDLLGTATCLFLIYTLTAHPDLGIQGAVLAFNAGFLLSALAGLAGTFRLYRAFR
jgi:stage V sporulation protein B